MHKIEYFDDFDGLLISIEGEPSLEEFLQITEKTAAFHPSRANIDAIYDLSKLDASVVTSDFLRSFVYEIPSETVEKRAGANVAYVALSPLTFGMTRIFQAFIADFPTNTCTFYTIDEAKDWIISNKK